MAANIPSRQRQFGRAALLCAALGSAVFCPAAAWAQPQSQQEAEDALASVRHDMRLSAERSAALRAEAAALRQDSAALARALAAAEQAERAYGKEIAAGAARLAGLERDKHKRQAEFAAKQADMAEILAALERLGLNPPPALLVHADNISASVESAALLGGLLPQLEAKTASARRSLERAQGAARAVDAEQAHLRAAREGQAVEQMRLALLLEEKTAAERAKGQNLQREEQNRAQLAEKAQDLQDLLAALAKQQKAESAAEGAGKLHFAAKFAALRGLLTRPVAGRAVAGGQKRQAEQSERIETAANAPVLAPADAVVRYAGVFRSYGQTVILDAGDGYYIVLAGMGQVNVAPGRFVLQGEPVGKMENVLLANKAGSMMGKAAPQLYIEIRKDGKPLNPAPWWAREG